KGAIKCISVSGEVFARWRFATVKSARRLRRIKRGLLERVVIPRFTRLLQQALVGWSAHACFAKTVEPWLVVGADRNKMDAHFKSWWKHVSRKRDLSARQASLIQMNRRRTLFRAFRQYRAGIALWKKEQATTATIAIFAVRGTISAEQAETFARLLAISVSSELTGPPTYCHLCCRLAGTWTAEEKMSGTAYCGRPEPAGSADTYAWLDKANFLDSSDRARKNLCGVAAATTGWCFNGWSDVARRIRFARLAYRELIGHHFILWRDKTTSSSRLRGIAYGILVRQLRSAWAVFREAIRLR
ncbi:hypothetical protein FOZ63_026779, partial [Perkinsus olseni]